MEKIKFCNVITIISLIATLICIVGMFAIIDACQPLHIVFMIFNMFFIGASWVLTIKENKQQLSL